MRLKSWEDPIDKERECFWGIRGLLQYVDV